MSIYNTMIFCLLCSVPLLTGPDIPGLPYKFTLAGRIDQYVKDIENLAVAIEKYEQTYGDSIAHSDDEIDALRCQYSEKKLLLVWMLDSLASREFLRNYNV